MFESERERERGLEYLNQSDRIPSSERLKSSLHCVSALATAPKQNSHTLFLDSDDDLDEFDARYAQENEKRSHSSKQTMWQFCECITRLPASAAFSEDFVQFGTATHADAC